jgi:hypothetical protein
MKLKIKRHHANYRLILRTPVIGHRTLLTIDPITLNLTSERLMIRDKEEPLASAGPTGVCDEMNHHGHWKFVVHYGHHHHQIYHVHHQLEVRRKLLW